MFPLMSDGEAAAEWVAIEVLKTDQCLFKFLSLQLVCI